MYVIKQIAVLPFLFVMIHYSHIDIPVENIKVKKIIKITKLRMIFFKYLTHKDERKRFIL